MEKEKYNEKNKQIKSMNQQKCTETQSNYKLGQIISSSESSRLEFKNYTWPFVTNQNRDLELILLKTICSFLNRDGGTILIGVSDSKEIVGIKVDNIDEVKRYFDLLKERFYPKPQGLIKTVEIPIRQFFGDDQYQWLAHTFVIRIQVKQGQIDRFYTFKNSQQQVLTAFREDASAKLIKDVDQIQEYIFRKCQNPIEVANQILYEDPDQEGLQEISNSSLAITNNNNNNNNNNNINNSSNNINNNYDQQGNYIAIMNIFKNQFDAFTNFLDEKLKERNIYNTEFFEVSGYALFVRGHKIIKLYHAIEDIYQKHSREIKNMTVSYSDLLFGLPKMNLYIKVYNEHQQRIVIDAAKQIDCQGELKQFSDHKEIFLYGIKNMEDFAVIYSYFKDQKLKTFINFEKPERNTTETRISK